MENAVVKRTMFVVAVPNLDTSAAFYRDVLGFTIEIIPDPGWRFYRLGSCCIFAGECPDAPHPSTIGDHSYFAYIVLEDIDSYHQSVTAKGVTVIKPLRTEPWGMREFGVKTVDGHRIMFGADSPEKPIP